MSDELIDRRIMRQKRGAKPVPLDIVRDIVDGPGDPHYRLEVAGITPYDLACALVAGIERKEEDERCYGDDWRED